MLTLLSSWTDARRDTRRLAPRSTLPTATLPRSECMPPSLVTAPVVGSAWQRLLFWLLAPAANGSAAPPPNRLAAVKREFGALLADVDSTAVDQLRWRIAHAHSLRELWHLRSEVYNAVAVAHSQAEAETRMVLVNTHFPTRAPRSQFAPL